MGTGLLEGSAKLLLLPGKAEDRGAAVQPAFVPLCCGGSEPGWGGCSFKDWGSSARQTRELQCPELSVEEKGLRTV